MLPDDRRIKNYREHKKALSKNLSVETVILFALLIFSAALSSCSSVEKKTIDALNTAFPSGRSLESRISGLNYKPFITTRGEKESRESDVLRNTEIDLMGKVIESRTADNLHALGMVYLAKGDFENAVPHLENAKRSAPGDARILNDLGIAYLEKSRLMPLEQGGQRLKMRAMALEELEKAAEIDPKMPEAVFNRSICRELLALPLQSRQSWKEYIDLDPGSPWSEEARRHIDRLEASTSQNKTGDELLRDFMAAYRAGDADTAYSVVSRNREMITGKLIPQRLAKRVTETAGSERSEYLSALEYIGKLENERSGDPFFLELAKYYSSATDTTLSSLGQAQKMVFAGYDLSGNGDHTGALDAFHNAQNIFNEGGNKWEAAICGYWIGYTLNRLGRLSESTALLESLIASNRQYKWILSQYSNWLNFNMVVTQRLSKAIELNQTVTDLATKTSDLYLLQKSLALGADTYKLLGQQDLSLDLISRNMELGASPDASLRQKWRDLNTAAGILFNLEFYKTSASVQKEAFDLATGPLNEKTYVIQSYARLGQISSRLEEYKEAVSFADRGIETAENLSDEKLRINNVAYARLIKAHIYRESGDCKSALREYDESLTFYDNQVPVNRYDAHKGRLRCYLSENDNAAAGMEISIVLDLFANYRTDIIEEENRNSFFDNEQDIYDLAIDYEFRNQNSYAAFDYSEQSRARSLLDMQQSHIEVIRDDKRPEIKFLAVVTEPAKLADLQKELPANVQIIEYSVLKDRTLIWIIGKDSLEVVSADVRESDLREKVTNYLAALSTPKTPGKTEISGASKELYNILFKPAANKIDPAKEICIIPDKILFRLPFSTLISPDSDRYLLADYTFVSAPSINVFLNLTRKAETLKNSPSERVLSIGNPSFDQRNFKGLQNIEAAESEAEKIAGLYNEKLLLNGPKASKKTIADAMPGADVIHFGGHYVVNERFPLLSGFVLSEDLITHKREDSILANYEILGGKLSNARLIVLAACETGVETYYKGEGMIGASRTFLASGVPLVVASQWAVDNETTADLMVRFHRYRKTGNLSTTQALRRAQLDLLEGEDKLHRDPFYWAGFMTFGGYAQF